MQNTPIFSGLKVIELASVLAGPSVGQFFAELGSEVIKVENPEAGGDVTRSWKLASEPAGNDVSAYFASVNMGKRSLALNLKEKPGLRQLYELVKTADIVIASYKPGDAEKLGLSYEHLKALKPGLIYGHITGFGLDEDRVGYDAIVQAESGFAYLNGEPGGKPHKMPVALTDVLAAHHLKEGILIALIKKMQTGEGSYVTVSLLDAAVSSLVNQATNWLVAGQVPQPLGSEHPSIVPYGNILQTADGHLIMIAVGSDRQFAELCEILGMKELSGDQRFSTNAARVKNRAELKLLLEKAFAAAKVEVLCAAFMQKHIPFGRVRSIDQVFAMPQARKMLLPYEHNGEVKYGLSQIAFGMDHGFKAARMPGPPLLGEEGAG